MNNKILIFIFCTKIHQYLNSIYANFYHETTFMKSEAIVCFNKYKYRKILKHLFLYEFIVKYETINDNLRNTCFKRVYGKNINLNFTQACFFCGL